MSGPNTAANKGYFRRKVTLACESCRRRRVKCSGSLPCSLCADSGIECTFDSRNRSRRGPRPRQPASASAKGNPLPRLAPRPSLSDPPPTFGDDGDDFHAEIIVADVPNDAEIVVSTQHNVDVAEEDEEDEESDSDASEDGSIVASKDWEAQVGRLISATSFCQGPSAQKERQVELVCHLIETFHARGIKQLRELLKPASFLSNLTRGLLSDGLIFAICAYSSRLSVHDSTSRDDAAQTASEFSQAARERLMTAGTDWKHINDIRSICLLVEYETACGNGRRAWADIAMGCSLLELACSAPSISESPEQREILDLASNHLVQARALHSLGRPHSQLGPFPGHSFSPTNFGVLAPVYPIQQRLHLLDIQGQIERLHSGSLSSDEPLHWVRGSRFLALQSELEKQLIQANISSNEAPSPEALQLHSNQGFAEFLQLSLLWHLCAITLNRIFLPIPFRSQTDGTHQRGLVFFQQYPNAPSMFLNESISRCDASADAIFLLARKIVNEAAFFHNPLLLGYACLNGALALLNRMHREGEVRRKTTMKYLQVAFVVLKAVGLCYQPAQHWLSVVRQAYSINEALNYALGPVSSLFDTFFSRFEDLEEAPIVPLDAVVGESRSSEQGSNNEAEGEGVGNVENGAETQQTAQAQENTDQSSAWQQAYASHLSKFVDQVDQPVEASLSRPEPPPISDVTEMTPCAAALSTEDNLDQMPRAELISTEGMMHVGDGMDMVDAHEAGAILASLSGLGQTPHFDLTTMLNTDSGGWETAGGNFDELMAFLQMPSLIDVDGMNLDMPDFM